MRDHARQQTALLIDRLALAINRVAREADAGSIHDLRVAMRRLSRCLRAFAPFYANRSWTQIRRRLSTLMRTAGAVRDCDIAIELMGRAGLSRRSAVVRRLQAERRKTGRDLRFEIRRWKRRELWRQWRSRLEL